MFYHIQRTMDRKNCQQELRQKCRVSKSSFFLLAEKQNSCSHVKITCNMKKSLGESLVNGLKKKYNDFLFAENAVCRDQTSDHLTHDSIYSYQKQSFLFSSLRKLFVRHKPKLRFYLSCNREMAHNSAFRTSGSAAVGIQIYFSMVCLDSSFYFEKLRNICF